MVAAAILYFQMCEISLADSVWEAQTHYHGKCQNRSFHCRDSAIFRIFKMAIAAILDFWNCEILLAIGVHGVATHQHANFIKIDQLVANILSFFYFLRWRQLPSWIVELAKFYWLTVSGGPRRITVPNSINICQSVAKILRSFNFWECRPPHLGFSNLWYFIGRQCLEGPYALSC